MTKEQLRRLDAALLLVRGEVIRAAEKHGSAPFNTQHEGYGILLEELDEAWDDIKGNNRFGAIDEMAQVGAMAVKFITSFGANL